MILNIQHRNKPIRDTISLPSDKSIAQRAIILSAIADGKSTIKNIPLSDDCRATINCIRQLGVEIATSRCSSGLAMTNTVTIKGKGLYGLQKPAKPLNVSESGTAARLLTGFLAGQSFPSVITGKKTLLTRPMERVIEPLRKMGARIESKEGRLPISISPNQPNFLIPLNPPLSAKGGSASGGQKGETGGFRGMLKGISYTMPVASAQVKSAILLAGLYAKGKTVIYEPIPTRDHTERLLNLFTAKTQRKNKNFITLHSSRLCGESFKPVNIEIPGDFSSAAYFIAAGLLIPDSQIIIKNVGLNPYRIGLLTVLKKMGARCVVRYASGVVRRDARLTDGQARPKTQDPKRYEPIGDVIVKHSFLKGIKIAGKIIPSMIDEIPILALIATQAKGTTIINGAGELRVKESDRLKAVAQELSKLGADIRETNDGLVIKGPTKLYGTACFSHNDHRIAMMLAIAGLIAEGKTRIEKADVINKSFPSFYTLLIT